MTHEVAHPGGGEPDSGLRRLVAKSPAWLASAVLHLALLGLLAQVTAINYSADQKHYVLSVAGQSERPKLERGDDSLDKPNPVVDPIVDPASFAWDENQTEADSEFEAVSAEADLPQLISIYGGFGARSESGRRNILERGGGTAGTEKAVDLALEWLQRHQGADGAWHAASYTDCCLPEAKCSRTKDLMTGIDPGLTSLAVLCFLGRGYTDQTGPFRRTVAGGLDCLQRIQLPSGAFDSGQASQAIYNHALCTLALCEAWGMTQNPHYKAAAEKGIAYILKVQHANGGWGYVRADLAAFRSDLSVTGWQLMALKSAELAGIQVPRGAWKAAIEFTDSVTNPQGLSGYGGPNQYVTPGNPSTVAVGLLCRQFAPFRPDPQVVENITDFLALKLPDPRTEGFFYYAYYGSLSLFQYGGPKWRTWNEHVRALLPASQKKAGCESGSWDPGTLRWASWGGRIYSTTMAALTLEVYYRYLPIHRGYVDSSPELASLNAYRKGLEAYKYWMKLTATKGVSAADVDRGNREAVAALEAYRTAEAAAKAAAKAADPAKEAEGEARLAATAIRLASVHFRSRNYTACIEEVKDFRKKFPRYADQETPRKLYTSAMALLARALEQEGEDSQADRLRRAAAEDYYRRIIKDPRQPLTMYMQVAEDFRSRGDWLRAGQMYADILARFADDPKVRKDRPALRRKLAACMVQQGEYKDAVKLLEELRAETRTRAVFEQLAECYAQTKQFDKALQVYAELRQAGEPGSDDWWQAEYCIARTLLQQGKARECERLINLQRQLRPQMGGAELRKKFDDLLRACRGIHEENGAERVSELFK